MQVVGEHVGFALSEETERGNLLSGSWLKLFRLSPHRCPNRHGFIRSPKRAGLGHI